MMTPKSSIRFGILLFTTVFLLGLSGCMATESQQGDTFVYKKTILNTLMLLGIAVTLLVFGGGILKESLAAKKPRKKKKRPSSDRNRPKAKPEPAPSANKKWGGIVFGSGLLIGGSLILLLGVPSSLMQHITVSKDKVAMRLSVLWFAKGTREIPFSSIRGIDKAEQEVAARRGTRIEETMILHLDSGTEYIEMGPLEKAAFPKLVEMVNAYRDADSPLEQQVADSPPQPSLDEELQAQRDTFFKDNPNVKIPDGTNPQTAQSNPANPHPVTPDSGPRKFTPFGNPPENANPNPADSIDVSKLTPVGHIGRLFKGSEVAVRGLGNAGYGRAYILEVYAEGKLKVMPYQGKPGDEVLVDVADARAAGSNFVPKEFGPGTLIDPANPPAPGTKLLGFHAGRWFEVELVRMEGTRPVIKWPGEKNQNIATPNMVRVPPPEGIKPHDGKRYNPPTDAGLTPHEQRGVYAKGNTVTFKEGNTSRKVIVVQMYKEFVTKVRDKETGEEFYALSAELGF